VQSGPDVRSPFPEKPTLADHQEVRRRYLTLSWDLYQEQARSLFFVRHPLPEEHLRIEVVRFWRGEISHLSGWTDPIGQVSKWIIGQVNSALSGLRSWFSGVISGVSSAVAGVPGAVSGVLTPIINGVGSAVSAIPGAVKTMFDGAMASISSSLLDIFTAPLKIISGGLDLFFKGFGSLDVGAHSRSIVMIQTAIGASYGRLLAAHSPMTPEQAFSSTSAWRSEQRDYWYQLYISALLIEGASLGQVETPNMMLLSDPQTAASMDLAKRWYAAPYEAGYSVLLTQYWNQVFTPAIPGVEDATRMLWRQKIKPEDFDMVLKRRGFGEPWASGFKALVEQLPGTSDLILEVVREVIPPELFYVLMPLQGLTRDITTLVPGAEAMFTKAGLPVLKNTAQWIWEAHWILPPPERTRTAFLRKQIPEAEYRKFLVWYDFKPEPRPGISLSDVDIMLKTQYEWPGRIDTRWLLEWGEITPEQGVELVKGAGFDPMWAPRLVTVYLLNQIREELGKVRTVYEKALREGFLDPVSFAEKLVGIHYAPHVINALRIWADEELALAEKLELADEYEKLAKDQIITPEQFSNALRDLKMVETRITRKVNHIKRYLAIQEIKAAAKKKAAPTK